MTDGVKYYAKINKQNKEGTRRYWQKEIDLNNSEKSYQEDKI